MTNLDVLRAVQQASWPAYCWPFANGTGNGYALGSSPSPPGSTMGESKMSTVDSNSNNSASRGKRSRSQSHGQKHYEDQLLKMANPPSHSPTRAKSSDVKSERLSPDPSSVSDHHPSNGTSSNPGSTKSKQNLHGSSTPSPSASPKSQASTRTRTPSSFPGTPPHPAFTPPISLPPGCFSPAALGAMGAAITGGPVNLAALSRAQNFIEPPMPRNCSDLMRSLAAKYNNNNNNNNVNNNNNNNVEFYSNQMTKPFQRPTLTSGVAPKLNSYPTPSASDQPHPSQPQNRESTHTSELANQRATLLQKQPPPALLSTHSGNSTSNHFPVASPNSINTLSSTQALLDMVRNASNNSNNNNNVDYQNAISQNPTSKNLHDNNHQDHSRNYINNCVKRAAESSCPLDLSSSVSAKRSRLEEEHYSPSFSSTEDSIPGAARMTPTAVSHLPDAKPTPITSPSPAGSSTSNYRATDNILNWNVEEVSAFVKSIDLCAEYADVFREQRIDGWCLSLLTEGHLTSSLNMKLGPALKLKSILSSRTGSQVPNQCLHCTSHHHHNNNNNSSHDSHEDQNSNHSQRSPVPNHVVDSPTQSYHEKGGGVVYSEGFQNRGSPHSDVDRIIMSHSPT